MQVPPDRIVAGTYICAAAATRGKIEILNPPEGELNAFLKVYRKIGGQYKVNSGKLVVDAGGFTLLLIMWKQAFIPVFPQTFSLRLWQCFSQFPEKVISEKLYLKRGIKQRKK